MRTRTETIIDVNEWDALVEKTYGKPYTFQQQDGCKDRGHEYITVPCEPEDYPNTPNEYGGVSFKEWLDTNPSKNDEKDWRMDLHWRRDFYPHVSMIINDLHKRGLLEAGNYTIDINW